MTPLKIGTVAALLAFAYVVAKVFSESLAEYMEASAVALVVVSLIGLLHFVSKVAADVARIRADLAQWMRDPKAADPEDSYLARLARTLAPK
ncbi:hypothetical protein UFOVP326_56 [uncultured Caudovirales phage]|uniref:Uncharacterized protein n=1 Tax=uncultured Caudovirales phage TaxID=2100421 RepID=A0A6J5LX21_9CAUD|nr:hypothetical protein UFOVP326_56 [uncultured Caudovirales phage]